MTGKRQIWLTALVALVVLGCTSAPAFSQVAGEGEMTLAQKWKDFIHYINIGKADMARSFGLAILESQAEPREIYRLSRSDDTLNIDEVMTRGARLEGMPDVIRRMRKMIDDGYQAEAANPEEIARSIALLGSRSMTQFKNGRARLIISGEYAIPQLLQKLGAADTPDLQREHIVAVMPALGLVAVRGYSIALQTPNPVVQKALVTALKEISYPMAAPRLKQLIENKATLPAVRNAALTALIECLGSREQAEKSLSEISYEMAEKYYHRAESLRPDSRYDKANAWTWNAEKGLGFTPVPRQILCDIYAMRMAQMALQADPTSEKALSLWLAAGLKREADLPTGAADALKGKGDAKYYALAAGPRFLMSVLSRGLTENDAPVALGAIRALAETGGADNLVEPIKGIQPLVQALSFPSSEVRFLAAAALADSLPKNDFEGSAFVMTIINEALRQKGKKTALLITTSTQVSQLKDAILASGYEVIVGSDLTKTLAAGRESSGIDMVVLTSDPEPGTIIETLRRDTSYRTVPVVALLESADLRRQAKEDGRVVLLPKTADAAAIGAGITSAAGLGIGKPLTSEEADAWIIRLSQSVRMLGLTNNSVHDVTRTLTALTANTQSQNPAVQIATVEALAVIDLAAAQQVMAKLGCSTASAPVRLAAFSALSESLRRFGNKVPDAETKAILDVVNGTDPLNIRQGAAQAQGAQNLSSDRIKAMVLGAE